MRRSPHRSQVAARGSDQSDSGGARGSDQTTAAARGNRAPTPRGMLPPLQPTQGTPRGMLPPLQPAAHQGTPRGMLPPLQPAQQQDNGPGPRSSLGGNVDGPQHRYPLLRIGEGDRCLEAGESPSGSGDGGGLGSCSGAASVGGASGSGDSSGSRFCALPLKCDLSFALTCVPTSGCDSSRGSDSQWSTGSHAHTDQISWDRASQGSSSLSRPSSLQDVAGLAQREGPQTLASSSAGAVRPNFRLRRPTPLLSARGEYGGATGPSGQQSMTLTTVTHQSTLTPPSIVLRHHGDDFPVTPSSGRSCASYMSGGPPRPPSTPGSVSGQPPRPPSAGPVSSRSPSMGRRRNLTTGGQSQTQPGPVPAIPMPPPQTAATEGPGAGRPSTPLSSRSVRSGRYSITIGGVVPGGSTSAAPSPTGTLAAGGNGVLPPGTTAEVLERTTKSTSEGSEPGGLGSGSTRDADGWNRSVSD